MTWSRRTFVKTLVATAVATQIPVAWLPTETLRRASALEYLRRAYNEWSLSTFKAGGSLRSPRYIDVGRELYDAAAGEMIACERVISFDATESSVLPLSLTALAQERPMLHFKAAKLREVGRGWGIKAIHG